VNSSLVLEESIHLRHRVLILSEIVYPVHVETAQACVTKYHLGSNLDPVAQ
jgi:hypothetical protein